MTNIKFNCINTHIGLFIIAVSILTACGNSADHNKPKVEREQPSQEVQMPKLTEVSFKDEAGTIVSLSELKGKVIFINFWATWCPPCIHEMPSINTLRQGFKNNKNIEFLMVDVDNDIDQSAAFMKKNNYDLPLYTPAGEIPPEFLGGSIPTTVILDKSGQIVERLEGSRDYAAPEIAKALEELTKAN
ncbi:MULTISPECIES: TlpA family protein disulfide reductase [unclassified Sphingobacterium]|uniref:TlpA family protein disulfide reductase n=1 Tax=unclassified Sphingobacterium TaxID=2609468 RepID=UPI0025F44348|nr:MULTISPECIES: TlpA disulfide reductase family protein [unclassified Sphingobacterium]